MVCDDRRCRGDDCSILRKNKSQDGTLGTSPRFTSPTSSKLDITDSMIMAMARPCGDFAASSFSSTFGSGISSGSCLSTSLQAVSLIIVSQLVVDVVAAILMTEKVGIFLRVMKMSNMSFRD